MEWNVWYYSVNAGKIRVYNVLHGKEDRIRKLKHERSADKDIFSMKLKSEMMYYFWSKFEWELTLSSYGGLTDGSESMRIDAWDQINLNWERFVDYCWENC